MIVVLEEAGRRHHRGVAMVTVTLVEVRALVHFRGIIIVSNSAMPIVVPGAGPRTVTRGDQIIVEGLGIKQTLSRVITILGMQ